MSDHERDSITSPSASDHRDYDETSIKTVGAVPAVQADLHPVTSTFSQSHDAAMTQYNSNVTIPDEVYDRIPNHRKLIIVALLSWCSFLAPVSSTTVLSAIPEVAATYHSTGTVINISNALYMVFMGLSPVLWGPLAQVYGRRPISLVTSVLFFACSVGTALAPNLASFFVFRALTAFEGTSFLVVGSSCIGDIYRPTERATALGWFMSGTLIGPALGPFVGGIIVTFTSWRVIFWLQSALAGIAALGAYFLLPETIHHRRADALAGLPWRRRAAALWRMTSPWRVVRLWRYPNLVAAAAASSALVWNMYSLLTPVRYVLNPRFGLDSPLQSGLFYLAPGCGYVVGAFFGGRYADRTVRRWIARRGGERVPEDRLRSAVPFVGLVIPASMLLYGWSVETEVGGVALPVVCMFVQGVAQLFCFPSLNTYCLDVMQNRGAEVIAGNYVIRYLFAAAGTATVLPAVEKIGVGAFSSVSAAFLLASTVALAATIRWGRDWRDAVDSKKARRRNQTQDVNSSDIVTVEAETETEKKDCGMDASPQQV